MTRDELKTYLRVDGDAEDDLLASLSQAAEAYLDAAGVPSDSGARRDLALKGLVLHFYDHRDDSAPLGAGLQMLITQLKAEGCTAEDTADDSE